MHRALAITLAVFALLLGVTALRHLPPAPLPRDAPKERFSAGRAHEVLERIVGDGATRAVGTAGNERARGVIVAELERLGWTVAVERAMACTYHGRCAAVANVVGTLPGREPTLPGVLLTSHYDSIAAGPGASDCGMGTAAVLETARALSEGPRPRRTVVALLSDGEEGGLLGAEAFVRAHASLRELGTTVNVDARGSRGPSLMFETSRGNAGVVSLMASHLDRPVSTSLFDEVYRRIPNDTDFSLTKTIATGVNFANAAGVEVYHTPLDTLPHADPATLQHHGDNVLGMARAFAEADRDRDARTAENAVWFDVLALGIVHWPEPLTFFIAVVVLALLVGRAIRARAFGAGSAVLLAIVPGVAVGAAMGWLLRAVGAIPAPWVAHPTPILVALHAAAAAAVLAVAFPVVARSSPRELWAGTWIGWAAMGVVAARVAPGASYLAIVPAAFAALAGALPFAAACIVPAAVLGLLVFSLATGLYETLGLAVPALIPLPTILVLTTLTPMLSGFSASVTRRIPSVLALVAIAAAVLAATLPKSSPTFPRRANVVFRQDDASARVFVDTTGVVRWWSAPSEMVAAIEPGAAEDQPLPWSVRSRFAEVPRIDLPPPLIETLGDAKRADGVRRVRVRLRSARAAPALVLVLPQDPRVAVTVEGRTAMPRTFAAGRVLTLLAVPAEGVVVEIESSREQGLDLTLLDRSPGVPPGTRAEAAVRARPADAVPSQDGDVTVVSRRITL